MALRYEGIEFDTVSELVEYKKQLGKVNPRVATKLIEPVNKTIVRDSVCWTEPELEVIRKELTASNNMGLSEDQMKSIKQALPRRTDAAINFRTCLLRKRFAAMRIHTPWTKPEDEILKLFYSKLSKRAPRGSSRILEKRLPGRSAKSILLRASILKLTKGAKPIVVEHKLSKLRPLSLEALPYLEKMLKDMILRKGKLSMFDAQATLQLGDGLEWCGKTWNLFLSEFQKNIVSITKYFGLAPGSFKIVKEDGFSYIKCGG